VLIAITSTLTSGRIYLLNPNDIEFVGVKVSLKSFSIYVTCSYIPPVSDSTIYEQHLSAIKTVLSHLYERDLLISTPQKGWMSRTIEESPNCLQFLKYFNALLPLICNNCASL